MYKAVKCPSCRMKGKLNGEDYALVATHRRRPVVQCFWCDSQVHLPRFRHPVLVQVEPMFEPIFEFKRAVDYDSLIKLMALEDQPSYDYEEAPTQHEEAPTQHNHGVAPTEDNHETPTQDPEVAPTEDSVEPYVLEPAACEALQPREAEPYPIDPGVHNLLQMANQVGWVHPVSTRYQPEFMNIQLPPKRQMTPRQETWHEVRMMMKYYQIDGGSKEQKRLETAARRLRMAQARQLRIQRRRLRVDLRKFETGEAI